VWLILFVTAQSILASNEFARADEVIV